MMKAPSKEDIERNQARQKKIHEILRDDAIRRLKNNKVFIPANKKLLELLIDQKEFVGNIETWMPSEEARDKIIVYLEDQFVRGVFDQDDVKIWFAEQVYTAAWWPHH